MCDDDGHDDDDDHDDDDFEDVAVDDRYDWMYSRRNVRALGASSQVCCLGIMVLPQHFWVDMVLLACSEMCT